MITMDVAPEDDAEFERWNEEEHLAERLACPGFLRATRYQLDPEGRPGTAGEIPRGRHMTIYELDDPRALHTEEYARSAASPSDWTRRMASRLDLRARGVYVQTQTLEADRPQGPGDRG